MANRAVRTDEFFSSLLNGHIPNLCSPKSRVLPSAVALTFIHRTGTLGEVPYGLHCGAFGGKHGGSAATGGSAPGARLIEADIIEVRAKGEDRLDDGRQGLIQT